MVRHFQVTRDTVKELKGAADFSSEKVWKDLSEKGVYGNFLDEDIAKEEAFDEWPTFIALFAQLLRAGQEAALNLSLNGN